VTDPGTTQAANGMIDAARLALDALDGKPTPALFSPPVDLVTGRQIHGYADPAVLDGLIHITFTAIKIAAMATGVDPDDTEALDAFTRRYLEGVLEGSTFIANGFGDPLADSGS
jgi:hypothetical protein